MLGHLRNCVARSSSSVAASSLWLRALSSTSAASAKTKTTNPTPFPYGIPDFAKIRERGLFFVDNSRFIPLLEATGDLLFFVRPPRFGKSLFVNMLVHYYDCHESAKAEFDSLFRGLDVFDRKTSLASQFHVLHLDFTVDTKNIHSAFTKIVNARILTFKNKYALDFDIDDESFNSSFVLAADAVKRKGGKLYVVIDEYDRYANKLLIEQRDEYHNHKFVVGQSGVKSSSPLRSFLETLKSIVGFDVRFFITGIMPLALADSSGFNVADNISHTPAFGELCGFRKSDLERGLERIDFLTSAERSDALRLMQRFYNGYRFVGAAEPLYNPTLSLRLMSRVFRRERVIRELVDFERKRPDVLLKLMRDVNVEPTETFVDLVRWAPAGESAVASLMGTVARLDAPLVDSFGLKNLDQMDAIQSLLFHQGIATFAADDEDHLTLKVPNELIRRDVLLPLARAVNFRDFNALMRAPTAPLLAELFREIAVAYCGTKMLNESTFQTNIAAAVMKLCRERSNVTTEFVTRDKKRLDMIVLQNNVGLVVEVKHVELSAKQVEAAKDEAALLAIGIVKEAMDAAKVQVLAYVEELITDESAKKQLGITSSTVLHPFVVVWAGDKFVVCTAK